ncbi:MAG: hypothetical protein AAFX79_11410 [Planctomycetota bacterium]
MTAKNADDAARLIGQLGHVIENRNIHVALSGDSSDADNTAQPRQRTSRDEQLERQVREAAGRGVAKVAEEIEAKPAPEMLDPEQRAKDIVEARRSLLGRIGSWIKTGYGFTVRKVAAGFADSTLNK